MSCSGKGQLSVLIMSCLGTGKSFVMSYLEKGKSFVMSCLGR
jgi:hypothetical protein